MSGVNIDDLKPNSHVYKEGLKQEERKEQKEKIQAVVNKAGVVSTKKPLSKKFAETFIEEDVKDVKSYIVLDVIIPGIKNTILDVLSMMFFKEPYDRRGHRSSRDDRYEYSARYKYKSNNDRLRRDRRDRDDERYENDDKVDYRNIVLRNRSDAEEVVDQMRKRIRKYDTASIADLFDLIDITGKYTDNNWGWDREEDIGIRRVSQGYLIDVAEAKLLDD